MKPHLLHPDGRVIDSEVPDGVRLDHAALAAFVDGDIEYVAVLFNGKPATMIVNEMGAVSNPPLAPNARATAIYWAATIQGVTGVPFNALEDPLIYGPAVLLEVDKRRL